MKTILGAFALGLTAVAAQAATYSEQVTLSGSSFLLSDSTQASFFPGASSEVLGSKEFVGFGAGFDDTLGTLVSVQVAFQTAYRTEITLVGDGSGPSGTGDFQVTTRSTIGGSVNAYFATNMGTIQCNSFFLSASPDCPVTVSYDDTSTATRTYSASQWDTLSAGSSTPQMRPR